MLTSPSIATLLIVSASSEVTSADPASRRLISKSCGQTFRVRGPQRDCLADFGCAFRRDGNRTFPSAPEHRPATNATSKSPVLSGALKWDRYGTARTSGRMQSIAVKESSTRIHGITRAETRL
jgi:hypothetical protein